MDKKKIESLISAIKVPSNHDLFYPRVFKSMIKKTDDPANGEYSLLSNILTNEYWELSRRLDHSQVQESCSVRNILRSRKLAQFLLDEKGVLKQEFFAFAIKHLKSHLYSLGPNRQFDAKRQKQILNVLELLQNQKSLVTLLQKVSKPQSNTHINEIIQYTLDLPKNIVITDIHVRQAVLAAWLCYLRQNVGSCFATAPAEVVHDEQPELFLQDMIDLLSTGRLKRIFEGVEYTVPLSYSWGNGDLKKPLVIRMTSKGITPELWFSQGLISAFDAVGLFEHLVTLKQKTDQVKIWVETLISQTEPVFVLTAEDLLKMILLNFLELTFEQLREYDQRPYSSTIQNSFISLNNKAQIKSVGVTERCEFFYHLFQIAKNAFKAVSDNALLKSWEFTLASFSETKYELSKWNFYASLGFGTNEPNGIGECIYRNIQEKLDVLNRQIQDLQSDYEVIYTQVRTLETRIRQLSNEQDAQWLKMEYQSRTREFYSLQEQIQEMQEQSQTLVDLYHILYKLYVELFKDYFQEIYDADMQEVVLGPFDDSPAGFRLIYKHGRSQSSQWTRIKNQRDFIDALTSFFISTERIILHKFEGLKVEKDVADVVSAIIHLIKTPEFLIGALERMAIAHKVPLVKNPLENLDRVEKKPWVYTSGGSMTTLVSCYYKVKEKPLLKEKWVENEIELLVFLADTMKQIPTSLLKPFEEGKYTSILMQSPTHAFILKPYLHPFKETWKNDAFTYTFIRDHFVLPAEIFVEKMILDDAMIHFILDHLGAKIHPNYQPHFIHLKNQIRGPLNPMFFREELVNHLKTDPGLRFRRGTILSSEEIDHFLYLHLPFFYAYQLKDRIERILKLLPGLQENHIKKFYEVWDILPYSEDYSGIISSYQLKNICKSILCIILDTTTTSIDYPYEISLVAQQAGFAMPTPIIFADTNWVKDEFGFVINPGTGKLELWRLDYTGSIGYPMSSWKQWLDGSRQDLKWGIYIRPYEYGQN